MNERDAHRPKPRRPRADARRNREQILNAATDLIVEQGPTAPMELIARRASVGIATLYRHFPDRSTLLRQVAMKTLHQSAEEARTALEEEPDAFTALARYMHDSIDMRIGVVMPVLAERVSMDDELIAARSEYHGAHDALITAAHQEGSLRPDVTSGDISLLIIRLTPPVPVAVSPEDNYRLSHRHLELMLDGMLGFLAHEQLPGPTISFDELVQLGPSTAYIGITSDFHTSNLRRWWQRNP